MMSSPPKQELLALTQAKLLAENKAAAVAQLTKIQNTGIIRSSGTKVSTAIRVLSNIPRSDI